MRKLFYVLTSLLLVCLCIKSYGRTIIVCGECNYSTPQMAIDVAQPHDTIWINPGIYEAINIDINIPLTLIGENATLDGKLDSYILHITADSVSVIGLSFINSGRSYTKDFAAIYLFKANYFTIKGNNIDNPFFGMLIEKSKHGKIQDNKLWGYQVREDDSGNGIHLWHCNNILIDGNDITGLRDGIYLEFVDSSQVINNKSHGNIRYGLHYMFSNYDNYLNNEFTDNGAGVAVMFSKFIRMENNLFYNNWGGSSYGLLLKEIYDAQVINNTFQSNTIAIFLEGTTRINYLNNNFLSNGWAIKVSGGCYTNIFKNNNFVSNSFDVSYNSKMNDNLFEQNYWSSYPGYDLDKDGLGDIPYRPVKLFSYIVSTTPESIVLLRSLFIDILNFSERVSPIFTPDNLIDRSPSMIYIQ